MLEDFPTDENQDVYLNNRQHWLTTSLPYLIHTGSYFPDKKTDYREGTWWLFQI